MNRKLVLLTLAAAFAATPALPKNKSTRIERIQACRAEAVKALEAGKKECRRIWGQNPSPNLAACYQVVEGNFRVDHGECRYIR